MSNLNAKKINLGRVVHREVTKFQSICWFNTIATSLDCRSPTKLEKLIQPDNIKINHYGEEVISQSWKRYRNGQRLPRDGEKANGRPGPVIAAEKFSPESAYIFRHPIWKVMRAERIELSDAVEILKYFGDYIRFCYTDLELSDDDDQIFDLFIEYAGLDIWIDRDAELISPTAHREAETAKAHRG